MNEEMQPTRAPGRPPKEVTVAPKKGNPTWRPANVDEIIDKEAGYRYRKINSDARNLAKKEAEGWVVVSDVEGSKTHVESGYGRINDGKSLTSVRGGYDYVLARMPEDLAQERDAYFNKESARRVQALRKQTKRDLSGDAPVHGSISIEKRGIRTVIKD